MLAYLREVFLSHFIGFSHTATHSQPSHLWEFLQPRWFIDSEHHSSDLSQTLLLWPYFVGLFHVSVSILGHLKTAVCKMSFLVPAEPMGACLPWVFRQMHGQARITGVSVLNIVTSVWNSVLHPEQTQLRKSLPSVFEKVRNSFCFFKKVPHCTTDSKAVLSNVTVQKKDLYPRLGLSATLWWSSGLCL